MARLEDLTLAAQVSAVRSNDSVKVIAATWFGTSTIGLMSRDVEGNASSRRR